MFRPPVDVRVEPTAIECIETCTRCVGRLSLVKPHPLVHPITYGDLVFLWDAEEHADDPHWEIGGQVVDEVELAAFHQRVERSGAVVPSLWLDLGHPPRGEHAAQEAPMQIVRGGVLEQDDAVRHLHPALDELQHRALTRDVRLPVGTAVLDVLEPAERVEVVLFVVVERRLVTHALPDRVRVVINGEVIGVVIQLALLRFVDTGSFHWHVYPTGPFGNLSSDPASTRICWPVMYRDSSLARKSARLAMSSGST